MNLNQLPDVLTFTNGKKVTDAASWEPRRREIVEILREHAYGRPPADQVDMRVATTSVLKRCCGSGKAVLERIDITFTTPKGSYTVPVNFFAPLGDTPRPLILVANFRRDAYDRYYPAEEILDAGFALASFCYKDFGADSAENFVDCNDFTQGVAGILDRPDRPDAWGKIALWAWGASRVLDVLLQRPEVDAKNVTVAGHSRLGKTALWCGAQDERVRFVCDNCSGRMGDALLRITHEGAETLEFICRSFTGWFCPQLQKYTPDNGITAPFEQHWLLAAVAPRCLCIASAAEDLWADPLSVQQACIAASPAWELFGRKPFPGKGEPVPTGTWIDGEGLGYHYRDGIHFFSRHDWEHYLAFIKARLQ